MSDSLSHLRTICQQVTALFVTRLKTWEVIKHVCFDHSAKMRKKTSLEQCRWSFMTTIHQNKRTAAAAPIKLNSNFRDLSVTLTSYPTYPQTQALKLPKLVYNLYANVLLKLEEPEWCTRWKGVLKPRGPGPQKQIHDTKQNKKKLH